MPRKKEGCKRDAISISSTSTTDGGAENSEVTDNDLEYDEGHVDIAHYRNSVSWFVLDEYMDKEENKKDGYLTGKGY